MGRSNEGFSVKMKGREESPVLALAEAIRHSRNIIADHAMRTLLGYASGKPLRQ